MSPTRGAAPVAERSHVARSSGLATILRPAILDLGHRWSEAYTEDGHRYLRCHNCGEDRRGSSPAPENALWVGNVGGGMGGMT